MIETRQFYDDLAPYYHLIFEDWDVSMARQGAAIAALIDAELEQNRAQDIRILDAACGIGTQTLPLAARGFQVSARDISPAAIARLQREADQRQLTVEAAVADMRQVSSSVEGLFDVVLAFDNSIAHLLTDADLRTALHDFRNVLRPDGIFLCSVRDYDKIQRGTPVTHEYGTRFHLGGRFRLRQEWSWSDLMHYQSTFIIDKQTAAGIEMELCTVSEFYAISTGRLLDLMGEAGFARHRRIDDTIYQPILLGRTPPNGSRNR